MPEGGANCGVENNQPKPSRDGGRAKKMKKSVRIHALEEADLEDEHYVKIVWPMFRLEQAPPRIVIHRSQEEKSSSSKPLFN